MSRRRAFTLIEVLIAISLSAIVTGILVSVFSKTQQTYALQNAKGQMQIANRVALDRFVRHAEQASTVVGTYNGQATSTTLLTLQLPSVDANQNIIPATSDYLTYQRAATDPTKFTETLVAGSGSSRKSGTHTIANNVSSLTFSYYDATGAPLASNYSTAKNLKIQLSTSETHYNRTSQYSATERVTLRNK